jgi:hypothetical protein
MLYEVSNQYNEVSTQPRNALGKIVYDGNLGCKLKYVQFTASVFYMNGDVLTINPAFVATLNKTSKIDGICLYDVDATAAAKYGWVVVSTDNPVWVNVDMTAMTASGGSPSGASSMANLELQAMTTGATSATEGKVGYSANITVMTTAASAASDLLAANIVIQNTINGQRRPTLWGESALSAFSSTANDVQASKIATTPEYLGFTATGDATIYITGSAAASTLPVSAVLREGTCVIMPGNGTIRTVYAVDNSSGGVTAELNSAVSTAELGTSAAASTVLKTYKLGALKVLANFTK